MDTEPLDLSKKSDYNSIKIKYRVEPKDSTTWHTMKEVHCGTSMLHGDSIAQGNSGYRVYPEIIIEGNISDESHYLSVQAVDLNLNMHEIVTLVLKDSVIGNIDNKNNLKEIDAPYPHGYDSSNRSIFIRLMPGQVNLELMIHVVKLYRHINLDPNLFLAKHNQAIILASCVVYKDNGRFHRISDTIYSKPIREHKYYSSSCPKATEN